MCAAVLRAGAAVVPPNGPYDGGNVLVVTNAGTIGDGSDITQVLVGGQAAAPTGQGSDWVSFVAPASVTGGTVDVVVESTSLGSVLGGTYTYNSRGRIFSANRRRPAVAAGIFHAVALRSNGSVVEWGSFPFLPNPNQDFVAVSGGYSFSMALRSSGEVATWGLLPPGLPSPNTGFVEISAGDYHGMALRSNGSVVCWGSNTHGQTNVPAPNADFIAIAAGGTHSVGLKSNGTIACWGSDTFGESTVPFPNTNFVAVAASYHNSFGVKGDGSIVCWGLTNNAVTAVPHPNTNFIAVEGGDYHAVGLKSDGSCVAWGYGGSGVTNVPPVNGDFVEVSAGAGHSIGLRADGRVVGWGSNVQIGSAVPPFGPMPPVYPISGSITGGYSVKIIGTNLCLSSDCTNVTIAGYAVTVLQQTPTQITVLAGAAAAPVRGDVEVFSTSIGRTVCSNCFTYDRPSLVVWDAAGQTITNGEPADAANGTLIGCIEGGALTTAFTLVNESYADLSVTSVVVSGPDSGSFSTTGFARSVLSRSASNLLVVYRPATSSLQQAVISLHNDSTNTPFVIHAAGFRYTLSTNAGPVSGGSLVVFSNEVIAGITNVLVGNRPATLVDTGTLWASFVVPDGAAAGLADIVLQRDASDPVPLRSAFLYRPVGTLRRTGVLPAVGGLAGGYTVTLTGSNLCANSDCTNVTLAGVPVASITFQSATQIAVVAGASASVVTGDVHIYSTSIGVTMCTNGFTYKHPPFGVLPPTGVRPAGGALEGGYEVRLVGTNLCANSDCTNVSLAGIQVSSITFQSPTQVTVVAGASPSSVTGDVQVYSTSMGLTVCSNGFAYQRPSMAVRRAGGVSLENGDLPSASQGTVLSTFAGGAASNAFVLTNDSLTTLTLSSWTFSGSGAGAFSLNKSIATVDAQKGSNFWITYTPSGSGAHTAALTIAHNATGTPFVINLRGSAPTISTNNGPAQGGNAVTVSGLDLVLAGTITSVTVGGVSAAIIDQSGSSVTFLMPEGQWGAASEIILYSSSLGLMVGPNSYSYNEPPRIGYPAVSVSRSVAGGWRHSLHVRPDGVITCWGSNAEGQCSVPPPNGNFVAVAAGSQLSAGLTADGAVLTWPALAAPVPNAGFAAIAAGPDFVTALRTDGVIRCWGNNNAGVCTVPEPNTNFIAVAASDDHVLALKADSSVVAWGGTATAPPPVNSGFVAVAAGALHNMGLTSNGSIVCWGNNASGQCSVPEPNTGFVAIAAGYWHSLGLKSNGSVVGWGANNAGQSLSPASNTGFVSIGAGLNHSLGMRSDGSVVGWGDNGYAQSEPISPVPVPDAIFPDQGFIQGGYEVRIRGWNLCSGTDVTNVTLAGVSAASIVSQSPTQIVVVAGATAGAVTGDVRTCSIARGVAVAPNAYTYVNATSSFELLNTSGVALVNGDLARPENGTHFAGVEGYPLTSRFAIMNNGNARLAISAWLTNGTGGEVFTWHGVPSFVDANAQSNVWLVFEPGPSGPHTAAVTIVNDSTVSPFVVHLFGATTTAWRLVGGAGWGGGVVPSGEVLVSDLSQQDLVVQASSYYHIAVLLTNGVVVPDATGLSAYTSAWRSVSANGSLQALFSPDLTSNQVPHWWLASHGMTTDFEAATMTDADDDAQTALDEYIASTDPTNGQSFFKWEKPGKVLVYSNGWLWVPVLRWPSVSGRVYSIYWTPEVTEDPWELFDPAVTATPPTNNYYPPTTNTQGAFSIRVRMAP
jgi:alpha-tubulin suppressor-like RCC1 family protein